MNIESDNLDVTLRKDTKIENDKIYNQIIVEGNTYTPEKKREEDIMECFNTNYNRNHLCYCWRSIGLFYYKCMG